MSVLLVVSRRRVLPIELRRQGFEVADVREVDHLSDALDASVSAVVVDAPEAEVAREVLAVLAVTGLTIPVVVLGHLDDGDDLSGLPVTHLEVPVATHEVAAALHGLLRRHDAGAVSVPRPRGAPDTYVAAADEPARDGVRDAGPHGTRDERRGRAVDAVPALVSPEPDEPSGGRWERLRGGPRARHADTGASTPEQGWQEATDVVLAALPFLSPVDEVVASLLDAAVQNADAQAGCVLLEEDGAWQVAAELGLRMGERRLALRRGDWLVERLTAHPVLVRVDDTDDARAALAGVPLASWRSVVAFPVACGGALVVLARDTTRFASDVVHTLPSVASLFDPLVRDALLALRLRRALDGVC